MFEWIQIFLTKIDQVTPKCHLNASCASRYAVCFYNENHQLIHTGEKPCQWQESDKSFPRSAQQKAHTGENNKHHESNEVVISER